jgi:hypothetical protein
MADDAFSIVVFPFLKTSQPVSIGGMIFRSTADTAGLPHDQAKAVTDISAMLFLKDDLRVKSATYAVSPFVELKQTPPYDIEHLINVQSVIAYIYSAPHDVMESVFLSPEHASLAVFSPGPVSIFLVRPDFHVESISDRLNLIADDRHEVAGFSGLYNFKHPFWVADGSRLYGPIPHLTLNLSQDLQADIEYRFSGRPDYALLLHLLNQPLTPTALRILSAVRWFNAANQDAADSDTAILNLAIAFEALLRLPDSPKKTERLVDAIALLLGRTERIDVWANQFYEARSHVAHEGRAKEPHYYAPKANGKSSESAYGSLLLYGRQIFQLCLGTLLVGSDLAERADLEVKLVTNNERFEKIYESLDSEDETPCERLTKIQPLVRALERYQFIRDRGLKIEVIVGAVKRAASTLLRCDPSVNAALQSALRAVSVVPRSETHFQELAAIESLNAALEATGLLNQSEYQQTVRVLVEIAWRMTFQLYYWLKKRDEGASDAQTE